MKSTTLVLVLVLSLAALTGCATGSTCESCGRVAEAMGDSGGYSAPATPRPGNYMDRVNQRYSYCGTWQADPKCRRTSLYRVPKYKPQSSKVKQR